MDGNLSVRLIEVSLDIIRLSDVYGVCSFALHGYCKPTQYTIHTQLPRYFVENQYLDTDYNFIGLVVSIAVLLSVRFTYRLSFSPILCQDYFFAVRQITNYCPTHGH